MSTPNTNEIEAIASDWLIRRDGEHWTEADQAQLAEWLAASTLNRVAFLRLELAWEEAARLKALGAGVSGDQPPPADQWNLGAFFDSQRTSYSEQEMSAAVEDGEVTAAPFRTRRRRWIVAMAASVVLALGATAYIALAPGGHRYVTPVGGLATVLMSDGSKITLNTDSRIRIVTTDTERRVDLARGEAFFEVAADPRRPFIVRAGHKRVVVAGTKFSVRRDGDDVDVAVTEGRVRVEDSRMKVADAPRRTASESEQSTLLVPGSVAHARETGVEVENKTLAEIEAQLSWRAGVLIFRDLSLAEAVAEFNRYNSRKLVVADPAVAALRIEGNFRPTNVDAFVRLLESGFPVRASVADDRIVLSSR